MTGLPWDEGTVLAAVEATVLTAVLASAVEAALPAENVGAGRFVRGGISWMMARRVKVGDSGHRWVSISMAVSKYEPDNQQC
jgi:hypothetical protein